MGLPIKQPPFMNVGAGQTCNIPRLDMGDTCDALILKLGGTVDDAPTNFGISHLNSIRIKLGGKTVVDGLTGSEIQTINKYRQKQSDANYLIIPFADEVARTITGEDMGGIDTSVGYSSFSIEVDIDDGDGGGGGVPTLECWMIKSAPKPANSRDKFLFRAYLRGTDYFGSAAVHNLVPPLGSLAGNLINAIHVFTPNDRVTRIDAKKDGVEIQGDGEKALIDFAHECKRTAQAGHIAFDPAYSNNQSDCVPTVRRNGQPSNIEFRGTFSAAETVNYVSEMYTVLDRI